MAYILSYPFVEDNQDGQGHMSKIKPIHTLNWTVELIDSPRETVVFWGEIGLFKSQGATGESGRVR